MSAIIVNVLFRSISFSQDPPVRVTIKSNDGLIADIPSTITSSVLDGITVKTARGLPDIGSYTSDLAINEPNDIAGTFVLAKAEQDQFPAAPLTKRPYAY